MSASSGAAVPATKVAAPSDASDDPAVRPGAAATRPTMVGGGGTERPSAHGDVVRSSGEESRPLCLVRTGSQVATSTSLPPFAATAAAATVVEGRGGGRLSRRVTGWWHSVVPSTPPLPPLLPCRDPWGLSSAPGSRASAQTRCCHGCVLTQRTNTLRQVGTQPDDDAAGYPPTPQKSRLNTRLRRATPRSPSSSPTPPPDKKKKDQSSKRNDQKGRTLDHYALNKGNNNVHRRKRTRPMG